MAITENDKLLIHFPTPLPDGFLDTLAKRFPQLRVHFEMTPVDVNNRMATLDILPAEVLDGVTMVSLFPPPSPEALKNVKFVQLGSAGWDLWLEHETFLKKDVAFCCTSGVHPPQIAEWAIGAWLAHTHDFKTFMQRADQEEWAKEFDSPVTDSVGLRMGIMGYGTIGRQIARLASALGMEIYVQTANPRPTPESKKLREYIVPGTSDSDGLLPAKWFSGSGREAVNEFLSQDLDVVVLSLPMNPQTRGCIGAEQFHILSKKKPFLINIARGKIVDTPALVEALEKGLLRGAALDVTDPEPLPKGHPLWKAPNVFITPHISWRSTRLVERIADVLLQNLERWDKGEPLLNSIKR